jgi:endoglucanase
MQGTRLGRAGMATFLAAAATAQGPQAPGADDPNPLVGLGWFIDKEWGIPWHKYLAARHSGDRRKAALIYNIASHPQFKWFGRWDVRKYGSAGRSIRQYLERVEKTTPGAVGQVATFFHQGDRCSPTYTGGGAAGDRLYRRTIRSFARGVGSHRVVIAFEPDSLGTVDCLAKSRRRARLRTLAYGVEQLSRLPNATVYLDAGASDWEPVARTVRKLRAIGVSRVRGFMLNATHMDWTANAIRYGRAISRRIGGKHFIVNTSDNGNGPLHRHVGGRRITIWCNPPNSALGTPATTSTADPLADAYFWVNRPGTSHGSCNGGPLPVGSWWEARALARARRAHF